MEPRCITVDPAIDLSGGPFEIGAVSDKTIELVRNPKWWGTPANARSITCTWRPRRTQLAQWMTSGYVQVAQPTTVTPSFLTKMSGLPGAESEVDTSGTLLQLDMASSLDSPLSPDLRVAIALTVNRQALVNEQASWAVSGLSVGGQPCVRAGPDGLQAGRRPRSTTTIPPAPSSTSTTVIGAGGSVNFPVTPVPDQAAALIEATGLVRTPGNPYYHSAFGTPFTLHMVVDESDPWAAAAAPVDPGRAGGGRPRHDTRTRCPAPGRRVDPWPLGFADLALVPVTVHPVPEPDPGVVHDAARAARQERVAGLDGVLEQPFDQLVQTASQQLNPDTAAGVLRAGRHPACGTRWSPCRCSPSRRRWPGAAPSGA